MKKQVIKIISIASITIVQLTVAVCAHGGNITGYKDKNSDKITKKDDQYYGYHKEEGEVHYHRVEWDEEKQRWQIKNNSIYYDQALNVIKNPNEQTEKVEVTLSATVDGDTAKFNLNNEIVTVRFLAIDTPETKHPDKGVEPYGPEASNFTKEKLTNAKKIVLEYDNNSTKTDKYNRHLAWIWVEDELLQDLLIENGLAKVEYVYGDYKYLEQLREKETVAKQNKVGIWQNEGDTTKTQQVTTTSEESKKKEITEATNKMTVKEGIYVAIGIVCFVMGAVWGTRKKGKRK